MRTPTRISGACSAPPGAVTHGNGPQVGEALLLRERTPLWQLVAGTQGEIGGPLAVRLGGVCLATHVVVDEDDPAFDAPTKPVGPVYANDAELPFLKDRVSALLAIALDADRLVIVTDVPAVQVGFGTPTAEDVHELSALAGGAGTTVHA